MKEKALHFLKLRTKLHSLELNKIRLGKELNEACRDLASSIQDSDSQWAVVIGKTVIIFEPDDFEGEPPTWFSVYTATDLSQ